MAKNRPIRIRLPACFGFFCPRPSFKPRAEDDGTTSYKSSKSTFSFNYSESESDTDDSEYELDGETVSDHGENRNSQVQFQEHIQSPVHVTVSRKQLRLKVGDTSSVDGWSTDGTRLDATHRKFDQESADPKSWVCITKVTTSHLYQTILA